MTADPKIEALRAAVADAFPELSDGRFTVLDAGWDSIALDVDDRLIFKFPRHEAAEKRLVTEASLLAVVRSAVSMPVPDLSLHPGPPLFSRHAKIPGDHLLAPQYDRLPDAARQHLAADLALFYAQLHALDHGRMEAAGARAVKPWLPPDEILRRAWPVLPEPLRAYAERVVAAWRDLPPDPYGATFGFFDGHGWNMAFDHARSQLNGVYDLGDSGFAPVHQEFIYSNWTAPDLTPRIAAEYEALTGRTLDRGRIELLSAVIRLSELAEYAHDPDQAPAMSRLVADWAAR